MVEKTGKKGGGTLNRSQMVSLRLNPRLRYLTDLAARAQRRTTSGFIEWAIENSLKDVGLYSVVDNDPSVADWADILWDVDEGDRFLRLAMYCPALLTHDEQILWKRVKSLTNLTGTTYDDMGLHMGEKVSEHWEDLQAAATGDVKKIKMLKKIFQY